jgi:hypothetical protein
MSFRSPSCSKSISLEEAIISSRGYHREFFALISNKEFGQFDEKYGRYNLSQRFNRGKFDLILYIMHLLYIIIVDEVPIYFAPGKTLCLTNSKAVHAIAPNNEGKRLATIDPFFDAHGLLVLPVPIILIGSEVFERFLKRRIYLFYSI